MSRDNRLTILLTLKDRAEFTFRWMAYANHAAFPFKVLVADGGADARVPEAFGEPGRWPNVDYEYVRYPFDASYAYYYRKVSDAIGRVTTPYVVIADNDDFYSVAGLTTSVAFLDSHPDYLSCGGQIAFLWVAPDEADAHLTYGSRVEYKSGRDTRSVTAPTARERIELQSMLSSELTYYNVKRTSFLLRHARIAKELNIHDTFLHEQLLEFLTVIAGKTQRLNDLLLTRQNNSPGSSATTHTDTHGDWMGRMLVPTWSEDFEKFVRTTAAELAEVDGIPIDDARAAMIAAYRMYVAPDLLANVMKEKSVSTSMVALVRLATALVSLPPDHAIRKTARNIYRRIPFISVHSTNGRHLLSRQSSATERELAEIARFVSGAASVVKAEDHN